MIRLALLLGLTLAASPAAALCPAGGWRGWGLYATTTLLTAPHRVRLSRSAPAAACAAPLREFPTRPSVSLIYARNDPDRSLEFSGLADCPTRLLVASDAGHWYFTHGAPDRPPVIRLSDPASGRIDVWLAPAAGAPACIAYLVVASPFRPR